MARVLLTNDDGIDSPTLVPLARSLSALGEVEVVVPERERSWIGKAISRFERVRVSRAERGGLPVHVSNGSPADCVTIGIHDLSTERPDLTVSGINLGLNFGTAFFLSSGTIGAVIESWIAGVPGIAFSMAIPADAYGLSGGERADRLGPGCLDAAEVASEIVAAVVALGFPAGADLLTVNMPADVTVRTPRRITGVTRARYGPVFARTPEGDYVHRFRNYDPVEFDPGGDVETVRQGFVSIAPVRLALDGVVPEPLRAALLGGPGDR
jgi:5'-nucleotidase